MHEFITPDTETTDSFLMDVRLEKAGSICPVNPLKDKFLQIKKKKQRCGSQSTAEHNISEQNRAEQNKTKQKKTEKNRT